MNSDAAADEANTQEFDDQYLTFTLGEEQYAIEVLKVREIRSWSEPTPLPHAARHVLGVINLRGAVIPIIDLRLQFGLACAEYQSTTGVIVVQTIVQEAPRQVGLVVDRVLNVSYLELANQDLTESADYKIGGQYVGGLSQGEDGLVIVLNLESLVAASLTDEIEPFESSE